LNFFKKTTAIFLRIMLFQHGLCARTVPLRGSMAVSGARRIIFPL